MGIRPCMSACISYCLVMIPELQTHEFIMVFLVYTFSQFDSEKFGLLESVAGFLGELQLRFDLCFEARLCGLMFKLVQDRGKMSLEKVWSTFWV